MTRTFVHAGESVTWPWGSNTPTLKRRLIVAAAIAVSASVIFYVIHFLYAGPPGVSPMHSDFSPVWYGAKILRGGQSPYDLIGPGLQIESQWNAYYPATAYVLAIPFTVISEESASVVFVGLSSFLLAFGSTRDSWHRLPMFASIPFLTGAILGQLSVLVTAILFLPWLAVISCAKPQIALPFVITSRRRMLIAVGGGIVVLLVSLVLLPRWPSQWLGLLRNSPQFRPAVFNLGGPLILLVLLKWKRPEAWIIAVMALMPQTWFPYNWIALLTLPDSYRGACLLCIVTSVGGLAGEYAVYGIANAEAWRVGGAYSVAFAYLPATFMVLRRPNLTTGRRSSVLHSHALR